MVPGATFSFSVESSKSADARINFFASLSFTFGAEIREHLPLVCRPGIKR